MADAPEELPYQSLYRRFRPATFADVKGQDHVVLALRNAVRDHRVAHAYLFSGPRGTGKTSTARILAKALNCTDPGGDGEPCGVCTSCTEITRGTSLDVHELDAASNNGVDAMRDLVSRAALGTPGRQKVYIVDEVHMLSTAASNALLKTLEEPPAHVVFVLATTDPQKVLPTIRSRTQHFEFHLLGPDVLGALLDEVRRSAELDVPDTALDLAVRRGRGSARDALSVLDQVAASDSIEDDLPDLTVVVEALADRDVEQALVAVGRLISAGFSPQRLAGDLVEQLRQGFLALVAPELVTVVPAEQDAVVGRARQVGLAALVRAMELLGQAQVSMRDAPDPRVNLEVALVRLTHPEADESPEALLVRIERLEASVAQGPAGTPTRAAGRPTPPPAPSTPRAAAAGAPAAAPAPSDPAPPEAGAPTSATADRPSAGSPRPTVGAVRRRSGPSTAAAAGAPAADAGQDVDEEPAGGAPEAAGVPPAAASAPPATDAAFPTRDELVQAWGDHILGRLRPKPKALFQAGRFVGTEGERALYGLPNEIHRTRCEEVRSDVEAALSDHFGRTVRLALVVDGSTRVDDDPPARPPRRPAGVPPTAGPEQEGPPAAGPDPAPDDAGHDVTDRAADGSEDLAAFEEHEMGEVADVDNSAETRVLQAFPGAEEVR